MGRSCNPIWGDLLMFLHNKTLKNLKKINYRQKNNPIWGDVEMFLPNKIIKNKKLNYPQKKCRHCTWF